MTEILILDYNRPEELEILLKSTHESARFEKDIVVLNNGGATYADEFKKEGLCNRVIHLDRGVGCGFGTSLLFAQCKTKYAFYIQVDHVLGCELNQNDIDSFIHKIENEGYSYVDLAGNQGHGKYSERAQFISPEFYNKIPKTCGGPGCWDHIKWSEECIQDYLKNKGLKFFSFYVNAWFGDSMRKIPPFIDNGKWSVRENPDGSLWKHRTDEKTVFCLKKPTERYTFPPFSTSQWNLAINGDYPKEGMVPGGWWGTEFTFWK